MATKNLAATISIGGAVSSSLKSAFGSIKGQIGQVGSALRNLEGQQRTLNRAIQTFGREGKNVDGMRQRYILLTQQIDKLRAAHQRLGQVQAAQEANLSKRAEYRGQIFDAVALGATAATPIVKAAQFENAMLGVAKQVEGARDESGKLTQVYYDMGKQIQMLGREIPLATNELADMVTAGARMGVAKNELIGFTRTAAMMADAFELPAGELADNMGKIAGLFKIPIPAIGELADSINYLDDNAISKGGDIIDFLTRTGGVASAVKVTGKEMAALGSTLLTLGERAETAGTATNAMFQKFAAADKGTKKFKAAMKEIGLSTSEVQKGMQKDATGTMMKVMEAIGKLPAEKQLGVMVELVGLEHSDTLAKLANNTKEWRRQLELANGEAAKGSMSREFQARLQTTNAQWQIMKNRVEEVAVNLGSVLLPAVNSTFGAITPFVSAVADFARENPKLTQGIVGTVVALTSLKLGALVAGYAFTFLKGGALSIVGLFYRTAAAATLMGTSTTAAAAGPTLLGKAFMFAGRGILWMGRALLLNPIGLAITAIAGAAYLIYENWDKLKPFFTQLWADIVAVFDSAIAGIREGIQSVVKFWDDTKSTVGNAWQGTKNFFGFGDDEQAASQAPTPSQNLPRPAMATGRGGGGTYEDKSQNTIQIVQQPGESQRDLAKRIAEEQERQRRIRQRSMMTDGVTAQ